MIVMEVDQSEDSKLENKAFTEGKSEFVIERIVDSKVDEQGVTLYKAQYISYKWLPEEELKEFVDLLKQYNERNKKRKRGRPPGSTKKVLADRKTNTGEEETKKTEESVQVDNDIIKQTLENNEESVDFREKQPWRSKRLKMKENIAKSDSSSFICKYCHKHFRNEEILIAHGLDHDEDMFPVKQRLSTDLFEVVVLNKKREYKCRLCNETFAEKKDAKSHQKIHDGTNPWYCEHCSKHYLNEESLSAHLKIHVNEKLHKCSDCDKPIKLTSMRVHKMVYCSGGSDGKSLFTCDICNKSFKEALMLKQHLTNQHSIKNNLQCHQCFLYLPTEEELTEHIQAHDQTYQCSVCLQTFMSLEECTHHATTHEETSFKCNRCLEVFSLSEDLEMHYQMSEDCLEIACTECNVSFKTLEELTYHLQSVAQPIVQDGNTVILYICGYCQRGFHLESSYLEHSETHVSDNSKPCPHCALLFDDGDDLTKHMHDTHNVGIMHPCVECNKPFEDETSMKRHARMAHAKDSVCRCLPCGKSFYHRADLTKHVTTKIHKNVMYERTVSGKHLESNEILHCSICERIFHNMNELKRHEYQHQKVEIKPGEEYIPNEPPTATVSATVPPILAPPPQTLNTQPYIDSEFYKSINGKDVIFTDEHSETQVNARITIDEAGNIGVIYLKDDHPTQEQQVDNEAEQLATFVNNIPNDNLTLIQTAHISNLENVEKSNLVEMGTAVISNEGNTVRKNDCFPENGKNVSAENQGGSTELSVTAVLQKVNAALRQSAATSQNPAIINQTLIDAKSQISGSPVVCSVRTLVDHNTTPLNALQHSGFPTALDGSNKISFPIPSSTVHTHVSAHVSNEKLCADSNSTDFVVVKQTAVLHPDKVSNTPTTVSKLYSNTTAVSMSHIGNITETIEPPFVTKDTDLENTSTDLSIAMPSSPPNIIGTNISDVSLMVKDPCSIEISNNSNLIDNC